MMSSIVKILLWGILLLLVSIFIIDAVVSYSQKSHCYTEMEIIPQNHVGLLLGTSKKVRGGNPNLYYMYRIVAAAELYHKGKVKKIICSGDNGTLEYNEPIAMKQDLVSRGVSEADVFLDYAGFRTLDSVVRARAIFGQESYTIISQAFHNERALFIARKKGINAIAYSAQDVSNRSKWKLVIREKLARVKMLLDLVTNKKPKFLGEQVVIPS